MSETQPRFNRTISAGNVIMMFLQCGGLGLLVTVCSYLLEEHTSLQQLRAASDSQNAQVAQLLHRQDVAESEMQQWQRYVTESLDEARHRLDRLDWVTNQRLQDGEQSSPKRRIP